MFRKSKKLISMALAILMVSAMSTSVFASAPANEAVNNKPA